MSCSVGAEWSFGDESRWLISLLILHVKRCSILESAAPRAINIALSSLTSKAEFPLL
jgi:hypothetical protein